ncbi:MAG: ribosome biogenesis GTPase YlqF [Gammaproteobacteria bacterium]|jgi:ribosome biogenesis GTPase A|nr:ribosome biogenesis GTPase YlqF [Gammaproteobacteria bacterium]
MAIHWYPGHMHKAIREMTNILPDVDLVIELLDARLPASSQNPVIMALRGNKPCIKILSKSDLADPGTTARWQAEFEQDTSVKTLQTTLDLNGKPQKIVRLCQALVPSRVKANLNMLVMVTGIPNVGKSTLINALAGRKVAKTGNEPAITKGQQRIKMEHGIMLLDTPGILWPKIENENSGYRLAASGAIKDTAMGIEDVAFYLADYLIKRYPAALKDRYDLASVPDTELEFIELMGARRGCLSAGGRVDLEKASAILVNEFRAGMLGAITLETPDMILEEELIVAQQKEAKADRDANRKRKFRSGRAGKVQE